MVTTTGSKSTMALADLLIALREPVPVSDAQIARGTARTRKRRALLGRRRAPAGKEAQHLAEVVAFVEEIARNLDGETLADGGSMVKWTSSTEPTRSTRSPAADTSGCSSTPAASHAASSRRRGIGNPSVS